jgi:hypothetical protein
MFQGKYFAGKYTTDVVASTVFGLKTNSFKDENAPFRTMAANLFKQDDIWTGIVIMLNTICPGIATFFRIR